MPDILRCYRCGATLEAPGLRIGRLDECPACRVPLHVCRMCAHFDPAVARQCREDDADDVHDKDRPNFCDYFRPAADAFDPRFREAEARARARLDALFDGDDGGAGPEETGGGPGSPGDLFR